MEKLWYLNHSVSEFITSTDFRIEAGKPLLHFPAVTKYNFKTVIARKFSSGCSVCWADGYSKLENRTHNSWDFAHLLWPKFPKCTGIGSVLWIFHYYFFSYLGRKKLSEKPEPAVPGSRYLVEASYSYWTLGYLLSRRGANKLRNAQPLSNLLPVDEFLPLLAGNHYE